MTIESPTLEPIGASNGASPLRAYTVTFLCLFTLWWTVLVFFYLTPSLDLLVARSFWAPFDCLDPLAPTKVCGYFPYTMQQLFSFLRNVFFYLPLVLALAVLWTFIGALRRRGASHDPIKTRNLGVALLAFLLGPIMLVNLLLQSFSGRPRPYETDLFGGHLPFVPAGSFAGACPRNCSFISGEATGAGWIACLIFLVPAALRPVLAPPVIAISVVVPAMRVAFGGHYLSDAMLGWLSSPVIFFGLLALSETTHCQKIIRKLTRN